MINVKKLRIGDIICTTSGSPLATIIKFRTWGWRYMFSQDKASHIATVVDRGEGLLYFAEMGAYGFDLTEIYTYDRPKPLSHVCCVLRHDAFNSLINRTHYNNFMLKAHAHKVMYGYEDLVNFLPAIHFHDNPNTWICSELPREGFKTCGIPYPIAWDNSCSPKDWQCWKVLKDVTKEIIA